ncbi:MAG: hypothetical protein RQ723_08440 [Desulfuromonadales bacterium]|nr:hypothetical protein [Desulfuromonadales bacterium]
MAVRQGGMALVSVVLLLATLMLLALTLTEKVATSSRILAREQLRQRSYWAASAAVEWARPQLASAFRDHGDWRQLLPPDEDGYAAEPVWTIAIDDLPVDLYLRDSSGEDDAAGTERDLQLLLLARTGRTGAELLLECRCGFDSALLAAEQAGTVASDDLTRLLEQPVSSLQLTD